MKEKWQSLIHRGPLFPKEYEYVGFDKNLSPLAEEMLYHYSAKLETEYVSNKVFNTNFWNALKKELPKSYQSKKFPEDFVTLTKQIFDYIQIKKEEKKSKSKEDKLKEAEEKEQIKKEYGFCTLNGLEQPIASPYIEGPGIFIARGKHPQLGAWKYRIQPEDVIINATNFKDIKPPKGTHWRQASENKQSFFLVNYEFTLSTGTKIWKGIQFATSSVVKQGSDQKKFEKAQKLLKNWSKISKHIYTHVTDHDEKTKQTALVCYLIMNLGIRVGDEKDSDLADTCGASSLRYEHVQLKDSVLYLHFLGKDSVEYKNQLQLPKEIKEEFETLINSRKKGEQLFPKVSSIDVKDFLSSVVDGLSAKVFRTAWGSSLLAQNLRDITFTGTESVKEKIVEFNEANLAVAKKLNHQKQINKKSDLSAKLKEKKVSLVETLSSLEEKYVPLISNLKKQIKLLKDKDLPSDQKKLLKESYERQISKYEERLAKTRNRVHDFELEAGFKEKTQNVALSTSRTNYIDPRICVSWCKNNDIPVEKVYSKTLQEKFKWALDCEDDFYSTYLTIE